MKSAAANEGKNPESHGGEYGAWILWILPFDFAQGWLYVAPQNDTLDSAYRIDSTYRILSNAGSF